MKHFTLSEFDSPDSPESGDQMKKSFLNKLDYARAIAMTPFIINSGYRTPDHNVTVGGKPGSSHLTGYAADIKAVGSRNRCKIVRALIESGFDRIGIGENFVHVDSDPEKDPDVIWLY